MLTLLFTTEWIATCTNTIITSRLGRGKVRSSGIERANSGLVDFVANRLLFLAPAYRLLAMQCSSVHLPLLFYPSLG